MLNIGDLVRVRSWDEIRNMEPLPGVRVDEHFVYGLTAKDITEDRDRGWALIDSSQPSFASPELTDYRLRFLDGELSVWKYLEGMLETAEESDPMEIPDFDPLDFLLA